MIRNSITSKKIVACVAGAVKSKNCHEARFTDLSTSAADVLSDLRDSRLNQVLRVLLRLRARFCPSASPCTLQRRSNCDPARRSPREYCDSCVQAPESADP